MKSLASTFMLIGLLLLVASHAHAERTHYNSLTMHDGHVYELQSEPETEIQKREFSTLTKEEREAFFAYRNGTLAKIANTLHRAPVKIGFLVKAGHTLTRVSKSAWNRVGRRSTIEEAASISETSPPVEAVPSGQLGVETIQATLRDFDSGLWNSIQVLAKPLAQKGVITTIGTNAGAGFLKAGFFIGYQFGLGWGYDKERKQRYVEYFYIRDRFRSATTVVMNAAIGIRAGYRTGPSNDGPNLQKISRSGVSILLPLAVVNLGNDTVSGMTGMSADLGWLVIGPFKMVQFGSTEWTEHGRRLYFDNTKHLILQMWELMKQRKNKVTLIEEQVGSKAGTCESLFFSR